MADCKLATYLWTWLALLALLGLNLALAFGFPSLGPWLNIGIAALQALLIVSVFMYVRNGQSAVRIAALAGFFWLLLLFGLTFSDYAARFKDVAIGRLEYSMPELFRDRSR